MKKSIYVIIIILALSGAVFAEDIRFRLDQQEYFFKVGDEAKIMLEVENSHGVPVDGILEYSVVQEVRQGGLFYSTSNNQSTSLSVPEEKKEIELNFGTSSSPVTLKINLSFIYEHGGKKAVELKDIAVHFVGDESRIDNRKNEISGSSKPFEGRRNNQGAGGRDPFGFENDPFSEMDGFDSLFQQRQRQMDEMMRNSMSRMRQMPGSPGGSRQERLQNNQIAQDSNALKQSIQDQLEKQKQMKEDFQKNLASKEQFQEKHNELTEKGYEPERENYEPTDEQSGSFDLEYKNEKGETASIKGEMKEGEMEQIRSFSKEDRDRISRQLQENEEFQKIRDELEKQGYKQENENIEIQDGEKASATVEFAHEDGKKAEIRAEIDGNEVRNVEVSGNDSVQEKRKPAYLLPLVLIILLAAYILYKKYAGGRLKRTEHEITEVPVEKFDYSAECRRLLEDSRELSRQGKLKEAYARAGRALRIYLIYSNNINSEKTNDEILDYLKSGNGRMNLDINTIMECFHTCNLVEFAKHPGSPGEFGKTADVVEKIIQI